MKKLRLDVDALAVERFDAESEQERPRGTVKAREDTECFCAWECTDAHGCGWSDIPCHTHFWRVTDAFAGASVYHPGWAVWTKLVPQRQ